MCKHLCGRPLHRGHALVTHLACWLLPPMSVWTGPLSGRLAGVTMLAALLANYRARSLVALRYNVSHPCQAPFFLSRGSQLGLHTMHWGKIICMPGWGSFLFFLFCVRSLTGPLHRATLWTEPYLQSWSRLCIPLSQASCQPQSPGRVWTGKK